jgi:hypothetical protein
MICLRRASTFLLFASTLATAPACLIVDNTGDEDSASDTGDDTTGNDSESTSSDSSEGGDGDASTSGDGDGSTSGDGDGGDGDGDGDPPNLSCGAILVCIDACPKDDLACLDDCVEIGNPDAQAEAEALLACVLDSACEDDACIELECTAELFSCSTGDMTCSALWSCATDCGEDEACTAECAFESTKLAQDQANELVMCIESNSCTDEACILENCGNEWFSCTGQLSDEAACPSVIACIDDCADDPLCALACEDAAATGAWDEAEALLTCGQTNMCEDGPCLETNCPSELLACSTGEASCGDLSSCLLGCTGAELCEANCVADATESAQEQFGALVMCIEANSCEDQDCIDMNCADEQTACNPMP